MNKVKMFFVAAAMLLVTAGVFAGKARLTGTPTNLKYYVTGSGGNGMHDLTSSVGTTILQYSTTPVSNQFKINYQNSASDYLVYYYDGAGHYYEVF